MQNVVDPATAGTNQNSKIFFFHTIGSEEMVTIDRLAEMIMDIASKKLNLKHIPGPLGVRDRNSDNRLILGVG